MTFFKTAAIVQAIEETQDAITNQRVKDFDPQFGFFCVVWDAEIPQNLRSLLAIGQLFQKLASFWACRHCSSLFKDGLVKLMPILSFNQALQLDKL